MSTWRLPGETGEDAASTHGAPYTPSIWTSQSCPTLKPTDLLAQPRFLLTHVGAWFPADPYQKVGANKSLDPPRGSHISSIAKDLLYQNKAGFWRITTSRWGLWLGRLCEQPPLASGASGPDTTSRRSQDPARQCPAVLTPTSHHSAGKTGHQWQWKHREEKNPTTQHQPGGGISYQINNFQKHPKLPERPVRSHRCFCSSCPFIFMPEVHTIFSVGRIWY